MHVLSRQETRRSALSRFVHDWDQDGEYEMSMKRAQGLLSLDPANETKGR